jgi:hypothetical protein
MGAGDRFLERRFSVGIGDKLKNVSYEDYEIRVGSRCADCKEMFNAKGKCKCSPRSKK